MKMTKKKEIPGTCPNCGGLKYNKMVKSGKFECFDCGYVEDGTQKKVEMRDFMSPYELGEEEGDPNPYSIENQLRIARACAHCDTCKQYTCPVPNAVQNEAGKQENKDEGEETVESFQKAVTDYIDKPFDPNAVTYFRLNLRGKVFLRINDLKFQIHMLQRALKEKDKKSRKASGKGKKR